MYCKTVVRLGSCEKTPFILEVSLTRKDDTDKQEGVSSEEETGIESSDENPTTTGKEHFRGEFTRGPTSVDGEEIPLVWVPGVFTKQKK